MSDPTIIPCYLAGPIAAPTAEERAENIRRIGQICRWLTARGYAVVTVHAAVAAGHYGDDDDPAERERGIQACEVLARMVADRNGQLAVLLRDDGEASTGTRREMIAFAGGEPSTTELIGTWEQWLAAGVDP